MFISKIRAEDRSPWGDFWFSPVGQATMSGMRVTPDSAMQLSAVFRAVQLVSGHMAMFPVVFYEAGTRKRVKHPLLKLFNKRPNRFQNAFEWRQMLQGHLELRGNAYNEIISNLRGEITELIPRHPDKVGIEQLDSGNYRYKITDMDGTVRTLSRGSIWHLRGLSSNGITGISTIDCARESFGLGLAAQSYGARFFANDAKPSGGWLEFPGTFKDKPARDAFKETWQEAQSGLNRGKLAVLEHGMKYHDIGVNNSDAQFIEVTKASVADIARWFGVPPHKIGDLDKATFSNIEQQALEYVQDALQPRASMWEASIVAELLFDDEEYDIEFDFRELLRGDSAARRAYYHGMILDGWGTRNEARDMEGMEPLDGLDEPLRPLNMVEESDAEDLEEDAEATELPLQEQAEPGDTPKKNKKPKTPPAEDTTDAQAQTSARMNALLVSNANRLARRFAKAKQADAELIAEGMGVSSEMAAVWCAAFQPELNEQQIADSLLALANTEIVEPSAAEKSDARMDKLIQTIAERPDPVINISAPVTVNPQSITLTVPIDANRSVTKTVISERKPDGTIISKVSET